MYCVLIGDCWWLSVDRCVVCVVFDDGCVVFEVWLLVVIDV